MAISERKARPQWVENRDLLGIVEINTEGKISFLYSCSHGNVYENVDSLLSTSINYIFYTTCIH